MNRKCHGDTIHVNGAYYWVCAYDFRITSDNDPETCVLCDRAKVGDNPSLTPPTRQVLQVWYGGEWRDMPK